MAEHVDHPDSPEQKAEGKLARKFREARERVFSKKDPTLAEIYRSMKNPGVKDVYSSVVNSMDTLVKAWNGREKHTVRTALLKSMDRVIGAGVTAAVVPLDMITDTATWLTIRRIPGIKNFVPTKFFAKNVIRMTESTQNELIAAGALVTATTFPRKSAELGVKTAGALIKNTASGFAEVRAPIKFALMKVKRLAGGILHPNRNAA